MSDLPTAPPPIPYWRTGVRNIVRLAIVFAAMFLAAGRADYWQGWVLAGIVLVYTVVSAIAFRSKADLISERMRPGPGVKWWDRIFYALHLPLIIIMFFLAALDGGRYNWSPPLPGWAYAVAIVLLLLGLWLISWAMWTNRFFSTMVRIQTDRGHHVVRQGPYRYVRHPGYLSGPPTLVGMCLLLGSVWALIPAVIDLAILVVRTYLEDTTLQRELPGYAEYAKEVRYRLLPGVW